MTHENIVRVFETNTFVRGGENFYFITMEFVSGESISDLLKREIHLPLELSMKIQTDYLKGLSFAQENKIIHRDINTDNILLSYKADETQALLSDFGLAQTIDQLSKIPDAAGRYLYFAPECYSGIYLLSSDVFSSGIVLYKMLTGFFPWECHINEGESAEEIGRKIVLSRKKKFVPASNYDEHVPESLDKALEKSLELDIEKRYKNDLAHSKWIYYYPNTNIIQKEEHYYNGIKDGIFNEYYFNRNLAKSYRYKNNLEEGEYNEFLPDGTLSVKGNFKNGLKDGLWESFREDGSIFSIGIFKNDFQNGSWKFFHRSGNISSEGIFGNGFEIDQWIYYYDQGQLDEIGSYSYGLKNGIWGRFHKNGILKIEEIYNLGRLINVTDYSLSDGSNVSSGTLKDGDGELIDYYDNGSLFSISNYMEGYLNGEYKEFHLNGKNSIIGSYKNNLKVGYWYTYNKRGLEIKKEKYD